MKIILGQEREENFLITNGEVIALGSIIEKISGNKIPHGYLAQLVRASR